MIATLLLAALQAPGGAPLSLSAPRAGPIVLRGSSEAALPPAVAGLARLRLVLGEARAGDELALAPHDWIADAPGTVERLASAQAFELDGGSPYRMLEALYPRKSESRAIQVLRERHRLGVPVIGTGHGAGFVSALTLGRAAERERRERNPRRGDPIVSLWALSILPWAFAASEEETAGDLEPFYAALIERHVRVAFLLGPRAVLTHDPVTGESEASGEGGVCLFDLRRARRDRTGFSEARVSWLHAGDRWELRTRRERLGPGAELAVEDPRRVEELSVDRALATESLRRGLARWLEPSPPRVLRVVGRDATLELLVDADTRLVGRDARTLAIADLRVDLRLADGHTRP